MEGEEFEQAGQVNSIDAFVSAADTNKWLVRLFVDGRHQWFLSLSGLPSPGHSFAWTAFADKSSKCPPADGSFRDNWRGYQVWVQCKYGKVQFNEDNCAGNG